MCMYRILASLIYTELSKLNRIVPRHERDVCYLNEKCMFMDKILLSQQMALKFLVGAASEGFAAANALIGKARD